MQQNKGYNNQDEGIYEHKEKFAGDNRYYLETPFGQVKVIIEDDEIILQFFTRKIKE